jgi:hypothetical protein
MCTGMTRVILDAHIQPQVILSPHSTTACPVHLKGCLDHNNTNKTRVCSKPVKHGHPQA